MKLANPDKFDNKLDDITLGNNLIELQEQD